ncbi:MAG: putative transporter [Bacteroidaceae bacterium]|nr:putative transporter [Bacteroidaceae bacterium]MDD7376506.1 putative transporter [Prevotellaceae bacterium]MDY4760193.1 putative transporter [Bacteroidaceae bacterium]PWL81112.1 MAG: putative transporter [Prevotellaceae bacterium]
MEWLEQLFSIHSSVQTVVVISLIVAVGLGLGKVRIRGISLGIAFVFFIGILAGHVGLDVDARVLDYAETFGLALFVYTLGLHVGPNFFGSLRHEGIALNLWGLGVIVAGTLLALMLVPVTGVKLPDMVGILCGATTNTPALGAANQALEHFGISGKSLALATAVTYPLGVVGVIFAMMFLRKFFVRPADLESKPLTEDNKTYIAELEIINPAIEGKTIERVVQMTHRKFIISRLWRDKEVIVPKADTVLKVNDKVMVVTTREDERAMELLFGKKVETDWNKDKIDWNAIDADVESRTLVVTRTALNGKVLGQLQLRNTYSVNVSRITRGDIKLLATDDLRLQYGDRVTVVGKHEAVNNVEQFFGNSVKTLNEPNIGSIFLGLVLGLALGTIPINIPGMDTPIRLGVAGGPIIMGILVGALGPKLHFISYTTRSASLMLRKLGLSIYLACLGLDAGKGFFATVVRPEGAMWVALGLLITVLPVVILGLVALKTKRYDFGTICGILCGSMANPMALSYANDTLKGDMASVSYASVYPLGMFVRVVIAQMLIMIFV